MILPYYKIEKTEEGRRFFYANRGYFNFWDEYLILNIDEGHNKLFTVMVNILVESLAEQSQVESMKLLKHHMLKHLFKKESQKKCLMTFQN